MKKQQFYCTKVVFVVDGKQFAGKLEQSGPEFVKLFDNVFAKQGWQLISVEPIHEPVE